jgi:hypothetical protein
VVKKQVNSDFEGNNKGGIQVKDKKLKAKNGKRQR